MEKTKQTAAKALVGAKKVVAKKEKHIRKYEADIKIASQEPLDMIREDEDCDDDYWVSENHGDAMARVNCPFSGLLVALSKLDLNELNF